MEEMYGCEGKLLLGDESGEIYPVYVSTFGSVKHVTGALYLCEEICIFRHPSTAREPPGVYFNLQQRRRYSSPQSDFKPGERSIVTWNRAEHLTDIGEIA